MENFDRDSTDPAGLTDPDAFGVYWVTKPIIGYKKINCAEVLDSFGKNDFEKFQGRRNQKWEDCIAKIEIPVGAKIVRPKYDKLASEKQAEKKYIHKKLSFRLPSSTFRTDQARVVSIKRANNKPMWNFFECYSYYFLKYEINKVVKPRESLNEDVNFVRRSGIHFYLSEDDAELFHDHFLHTARFFGTFVDI